MLLGACPAVAAGGISNGVSAAETTCDIVWDVQYVLLKNRSEDDDTLDRASGCPCNEMALPLLLCNPRIAV
jgi:hypothetical protein